MGHFKISDFGMRISEGIGHSALNCTLWTLNLNLESLPAGTTQSLVLPCVAGSSMGLDSLLQASARYGRVKGIGSRHGSSGPDDHVDPAFPFLS
jgi:hypothetical protein